MHQRNLGSFGLIQVAFFVVGGLVVVGGCWVFFVAIVVVKCVRLANVLNE